MSVDLELIEARWRIGLTSASDLHAVANELLDNGVSSDSLIDLFALPVDVAVWKGPGLFDRTLCELGGGEMTEPEAAQVLARDIARDVLSGTLEPSQATGSAASIYVRTGYRFDSFHQLYVLDEEMSYFDKRDRSYLGRSRDAVENDVRSEAKRLLKSPSDP